MKSFLRLLLCLSLSGFAVARASSLVKNPSPTEQRATVTKKADAKTILHDAKKATAALIKNARADKDLDPKKAKNKPFWKSVHLVAQNLKTAETGLAAKNADFFKGIADARKAEEQMKVDWQLTDSKNSKVIENGKKLGYALAILRTDFSKEALRKKKGGELTDKEKAQFEKIKAQQKELLAKIKKLEGESKNDKALGKGLAELKKQAERVVKEPATVDAYIATLYLLDIQAGLIRGYEYYVDRNWRKDYLILVDYTKTYDTWYTAWETSVTYDWAVVTTTVDVQSEDVDVSDNVSDQEISSEDAYAENESFDMNEAEQDEVAADENTDEEVASTDDDTMQDASDDEGEDMSEADDSAGDDAADDASDDGGDDGGD